MAYATLDQLKGYMGNLIQDNDSDETLQLSLDAAADWIDSPDGCGQSFVPGSPTEPPGEVTQHYVPERDGKVTINDFIAVRQVALDVYYNQTYSVILQPSDYYLWPLDGPTYNEIRSAVGAAHCIYAGQFVEVIGQQGSGLSAVPAGVILANMILAIRFFKRNEAPFGVLAVPETGTVARLPWQDPDVEMLLGPYRHGTGIPVMVV